MNSKTFRRISSGLLSLILVLQVLVQPVMAVQNTNDLPTETKTEEMKNDAHSETIISPAVKKKLSPLELNYVNRLEDDSFAFLRGPFVMSSEEDFDIKDYTFVEKDEKGKVSIIKGEDLEEFSNVDELNKIIKEYRENYELYKEEKLQELELVEALLTINYKEYDELSVPLVINDLENKYESTKNETLTLKRDEEELTKEIFVNSLKDLEELLLSFKGEEEVKDLDIIKVEKVYSGEEDEDTITVEKVFEEVLEEAHEDENKVTSLNLDELDPGYKYIFTLQSKQVKDDNKVLTEITSLEKDQDETEIEELGKTIVEEETETETTTEEATDVTEATEATEKESTKENVQETKEQKEKTPQENKIDDKKEVSPEEDEKVQEFEKALEETKEEIKQDPKNKEEKKGVVEGIKKLFGLTDLQKADKELKAALKDEKNGLEEIQKLLNSFEEKYELSKEEQLQLMDDNGDAIKALIAKDGEENFRPQIFAAKELNLEGKKFNILTRFDTSTAVGPIKKGQYFNIHLDEKLTVKPGTNLEPIKYNNEVIAEPEYDKANNIIKYKIVSEINENLQIPLNIPVDYNTSKIKLDDNGEFVVTNKVSGLGVKAPKDLVPQRVDRGGNLAGSIIEPDRKDVTEIIEPDDANYKISTDAVANPVIKDGELVGYNWTIKVSSDTDLDKLGYKANFTTVKGSGLGEIEDRNNSLGLQDQLKGDLGIVDSKHHSPGTGVREVTYNLFTPTTNKQEKYMMDISIVLTEKDKVGAKRIVIDEGWPMEKVREATPSRVGMNNRTTIFGEFSSNNSTKWTVTDAVSTGDTDVTLPLETRKISDHYPATIKMAVYGLDKNGKMVQTKGETKLKQTPDTGKAPEGKQSVGTIAVYEYLGTSDGRKVKKPITLGGVSISTYEDIIVDQNWNLDQGLTMPAMTVKAVDASNEKTELGQATTTESGVDPNPAQREITLKDTKVWNIGNNGEATRYDLKIKQDFPTNKTYNGKAISYYENNNWKDPNKDNTYYIHNKGTVEKAPQFGNFTLIKTGEDDKPLPGAIFKLLGQGEAEVATDKDGKIRFQNIAPGSYTLMETKAPKGYKLNQERTTVNVDENGRISTSGSSAKLEVGDNPTVTVAHKDYPDFMNAMQYARVNSDGTVTTYIYLKANEAKTGGSTDKNTRLNLRVNGGKIAKQDDVQVYDVSPYNRDYLRTEMIQQGVDQDTINRIGNINVLKTPNRKPIRATLRYTDPYTKQEGYRIRFPQERFENDWGYLVVANSPAGTSVTYDWLVDGNNELVGNNARLQNQTITPSTEADAKKETTITISNEKFETRPVEVMKWDKDKKPVAGATFELRDAKGKLLATVESQAADKEGKNGGLASFGDLPEGKYTIEEVVAPDGYIKSDVIFDVTVDESNQVTYKPRFKNGTGSPLNGEDYYIEDIEQDQDKISAKVTNVSQSLVINEGDTGDVGTRPQVWEAYRLESLKYNATIDLTNTAPGQRFSIQFDRNLDFTQYFGEFPKINVGGVEVADPYFDYTTNKLTYVYNEKSAGGKGQAKIELKGIIPSKYFAQNDGTFPFTVTVAPGQTGVKGQQTITTDVPADYGQYDYDRHNKEVPQSYYFRDVYKQGNDWYVAVLAYYNPDHIRESDPRELEFNWLSTNYQGATKNFFTWEGNGNKPAFSLTNVNVYRTSPNMGSINAGNFDKKINYNMPLSFGVRPGDDPAKYNLIYSRSIDPRYAVSNDRQGGVTLNYDPSQIQDLGVITKNSPLRIEMPAINNFSKNGYIIEQTFKIDDLYNFNNLWRVFCMTNNRFKSSFITRANYNKATGDQAGGEIPKFFSQKVALLNKKYEPGSFKIKKLNDANREQVLQGASFSLTDENNNTIYRSSGQDGIVDFKNIKLGIYTLKEESAPDKFIKTDKTWRVNVANDGNVSIVEIGLGSTGETLYGKDTIVLPVANKPVATEFKVYKRDNENQPLQGAEFKITKAEDGTEVATGTSDKNGTVSFGSALEKGTYILEETKAPDGYNKLDKKWVLEVDDNKKVKVYNYIEGPKEGTNPEVNKSILGEAGTKWVNVAKRPIDGWNLGDNRQEGYYNNYPIPYRLGTRIVGKNAKDKYVIQRYVINPEADSITLNSASIHRERPQFTNLDWYKGNETYKIFELDKAVDGNVEDIRLENYKLKDITKEITKKKDKPVQTEPDRLILEFNDRQITKPIVIDVKVPYKSEDGGVGTGMDLQTNKGLFWKSDYYRRADRIVEGDPVTTSGEAGNIKGAYVSDDALDVTNERLVQEFSFKKVGDGGTDAVTGATFKLQGPKKSDDDLGPEVCKKSGTNGIVNFDNLTPGIYHLTESGAAQGYEKANTDWTVTVTKDNKIYIRDNNPGSTVPDQGAKWQKVDTTKTSDQRHTDSYTSNGSTGKIETKITEVNKKENKFKQVYIINRQPEYLENTYFEIHAQKENRPINTSNTRIVSMNLVDPSSTFDNLKVTGSPIEFDKEVYTKNNQERIKITPKNLSGQGKTIAITVESSIPYSGNVGTGMDFYNYGSNHYWVTEWYDSLAGIPLVETKNTTTYKNADLKVGEEENTPKAVSIFRYQLANALLQSVMNANLTSFSDAGAMGGLEIGDELVGQPVGAGEGWQPIDPTRSDEPDTRANPNNPVQVQTKITHINKDTKEFKQVFLINGRTNNNNFLAMNLHRQPLANIAPTDIVSYEVYTTNSTSIDNVVKGAKVSPVNNPANDPYNTNKVRISWTRNKNTYFYIEVTAKYVPGQSVGLGMDYFNDKSGKKPNEWKGPWGAQNYSSDAAINKENEPKITYEKASEVSEIPIEDYSNDPSKYVNDPNLEKGQYRIVDGEKGSKRTYYLVEYKDGEPTGNRKLDTSRGTNGVDIIKQMTPKLRYVGTKDTTQTGFSVWVNSTKLSASPNSNVTPGTTVKVTVTPGPNEELDTLYYNDGTKNVQIDTNTKTFTMPSSNVTVNATFKTKEAGKYKVTVIPTEGGTVKADKETAEQGEEVKLTITPDPGYQIQAFLLLDKNEGQVQGSSINHLTKKFTMPAEDVWVKILFKKVERPTYYVFKDTDGRGYITINGSTSTGIGIPAGDKVNFQVTAYDRYKITGADVKKAQGGGTAEDFTFDPSTGLGSFTMPTSNVTIYGYYTNKPAGERTASEERTETLNFKTEVTVDPNLQPGQREVDQEGKNGEVKYRYTATYNKATTGQTDVAAPADWPADVIAALKAGKKSGEVITEFKKIELSRTEPTNAKVRVGKSDDPIDSFVPDANDKLVKDGETQELVTISNKKAGISPKILKRTPGGAPLPGATFTVNKMTDDTYEKVDESFGTLTATSDKEGNVIFKDQADNVVKLQKGYYVIKETKAPLGYKKVTADWKIEIKDDGGRMYAEYQGPEDIPSSLIDDNKKAAAGSSASNAQIKYKARLTYIDPEANTYIQRIYIDTRGYYGSDSEKTKGLLNLQITPKYKREEIDIPGESPQTIKDGVKTAYYQSFKLADTTSYSNMDDPAIDKVLRTYDLAKKDLSLDKTARWRPFDWGFDEDQLNLGKGVYIVEVEGFYDDVIINNKSDKTDKYDIPEEDRGKIDLHVDFYEGARHFKQLKIDKNGNTSYEAFDGASYQGGAAQITEYIKSKEGEDAAKAWSQAKSTINGKENKYKNFIAREVEYNGKTYKTGIIDPALPKDPAFHGDTSINLNPLYNSVTQQEIPREGLEVENEEETYNITFSKHGKDKSEYENNGPEVTKNRLEGAIFQLQVRGPGGIYEDMPGKTVASAFNGYFGFRGLKPGRYRLMEIKAPQGYVPIKDAVLHFTIAYEKGKIDKETGDITPGRGVVTLEYNEGNSIFQYAPDNPEITPESGKLTDYVTSATAKNMGKIINNKPGKGKVEITKKDGANNLLPGAEFKLTRITSKEVINPGDNKNPDGIYNGTVGQDGKLVFDNLTIGQYELEETKAPTGYQNKGGKWKFTVGGEGLDPYAGDIKPTGNDMSDKITFESSDMTVQRPRTQDNSQAEKNTTVRPNRGQQLSFFNKFTVKAGNEIKPGDYFKLKVNPNLDLEGIVEGRTSGLDIFADGVGTIAKATYDKAKGEITYTFTEYAKTYDLKEFTNTISTYIQTQNVKNNANNVSVGFTLGDTNKETNVNVVYDVDIAQFPNYYNYINMTSKIVKYDNQTGEFVHYYYINPMSRYMKNTIFDYLPENRDKIEDLRMEVYYLTDSTKLKEVMPDSFAVDESSPYLRKVADKYSDRLYIGAMHSDNHFFVKVTGKATDSDLQYYSAKANLYWKDPYSTRMDGATREDEVYLQENKAQASAKLEITALNPKHEIVFKKVDQEDKILPGAKFKLVKYYEKTEDGKNWVEVTGSERTSDKDGLIKYDNLDPGKYALIETEAPKGYAKIEGHIEEFTVGENGVITRQVAKPAEEKSAENQTVMGKLASAFGALANNLTVNTESETYTEEVTTEPIKVINYKNIEFVKVDGDNTSKTLAGAEFKVYYKETETGDYKVLKEKKTVDGKEVEVENTVTSGKDGKFSLNLTKPGYYALEETKAPDGYTRIPGKIKEFRVENGKVQMLEKDPLKSSLTIGKKRQITSQVLSVDKENKTFTQRIVINPKHDNLTGINNSSYLRILENGWSITPKFKGQFGGGEVKVALINKDSQKSIADLTDKDFKKLGAIEYGTVGNNRGSRYSLKELLGKETDESVTSTTDTIVVEYTGKIDDTFMGEKTKYPIKQKAELIIDNTILDTADYNLDLNNLSSKDPVYVDKVDDTPIQVENTKTEYPLTGGIGALIFAIIGAGLMTAAYIGYKRKKVIE